MQYLPLIAFAAIILIFITYVGRQRRKQQAVQQAQADALTIGTEVMTTSGLYGTIVGRDDEETVTLAIAPGVEVRWALAALRDVAALPTRLPGVGAPGRAAAPNDAPTDAPTDAPIDAPIDGVNLAKDDSDTPGEHR